jgi:hypothetical protein
MIVEYENTENSRKSYIGLSFKNSDITHLLQNQVKEWLTDYPQREAMVNYYNSLMNDTGFEASETLLTDIQYLLNKTVGVQDFKIGEALAHITLQNEFNCRFYWNPIRDTRNPKGNSTGADLVGFIEIENDVLFLFGEVKTSSEVKTPPQVITNPTGLENQLKDLYKDQQKRLILISYIKSKIGLNNDQKFKDDFDTAIRNYYKQNGNYNLIGILVRDTDPHEDDLRGSFERLKQEILDPIGLQLLALYVPIKKEKWLHIIKGENYES